MDRNHPNEDHPLILCKGGSRTTCPVHGVNHLNQRSLAQRARKTKRTPREDALRSIRELLRND